MNLKLFVLSVCLLAFSSIGLAQTDRQADYIGDWSNGRAFQMFIDNTTIKFESKGNKTQTYKYRDITPADSGVYFLEIISPTKDTYFSKFIALTLPADQNELAVTNYNSLADLKAGKNPQGNDTWFRDGVVSVEDEKEGFAGALQTGKTESVILYFGEESGDYAAFCFTNDSDIGRKILAACKNGDKCEFVGEIDYESACQVPGLEADLSAAGKIISLDTVKKVGGIKTAAIAPEQVVRNLYAEQEAGSGPFFQTKNRSLVDLYFTKDLADMIWKDSIEADGEVGAIDFDPLYNSQDPQMTKLSITKSNEEAGGPEHVFVTADFKSAGKPEKVEFELQLDEKDVWKIVGIYYSNGEDLGSILQYYHNEEFRASFDAEQTFKGDYLVGTVKCNVTPTLGGFKFRVECAGQEDFRLYFIEGDEFETAYIYTDEKGVEKGKFIFKNGESSGRFIGPDGKTVKVSPVKQK